MVHKKNSALYAIASVALLQTALALLGGCTTKTATQAGALHNPGYITTITAQQLRNEILHDQRIKVVNVLDAATYNDCNITNSINVPLSTLKKTAQKWQRGLRIVVYCANYECAASKHAFNILHTMGFTNIDVYEGGTKEWRDKGYPTSGPCRSTYLAN